MSGPRVRLSLVLSAFVLAAYGQSQAPVQTPVTPLTTKNAAYVADHVLVKPRRGVSGATLAAQHAAIGAQVMQAFAAVGDLQVVQLTQGATVSVADAIEQYRRSGLVEYAEPDYIVQAAQAQYVPNDLSPNLWGLHNTGQTGGLADADIDAPEAWSTAFSSSNIIVGVVDTGIDYTHPDLNANMWVNSGETPGDGIDNDGNGYVDDVHGINAIAGAAQPGNPMDDHYHGTHVAGTIGAVGNNGIGIVGITGHVRLMALKFLNSGGSGSVSDAIRAIDYARGKGARILNNSWGGGGYSQGLYDAIAAARDAGIVFVAAAGNNTADNDATVFYPASYNLDNIVSVAATNSNDGLAYFSNFGYSTVELGAPGESIYSTYPGNQYAFLSGTSMASPHVSGALALLSAYRPELNTAGTLIAQLLGTVDRIPALEARTRTGGRLNLAKALTGTPAPTAHLTASPRVGSPGDTVTFTDNSFGQITSRSLNFGDGSPPTTITNTTHQYPGLGNYTATLTVDGPGGTHTRTQFIVVQPNYTVQTTSFAWVDTSGFTTLGLSDDGATGAIPLPFTFNFYGQNYSSVYVGSNGLLTLASGFGTWSYENTSLPSPTIPNGAIYAYWDDLNPAMGGAIKYGVAADGSFVVSWEGLPHYNSPSTLITCQVILEQSGAVRMQYLDVQPSNAFGAGRSATVGVENADGQMARLYSYNGSPLLTNGLAIRFTMGVPPTIPAAPTGLTATAGSPTEIALAWTDNANDETLYRVERKTTGSFAVIVTLAANSTSYQDAGLSPSTTYTYRVVASNSVGDSGPSNDADATTQQEPPPSPPTFTVSPGSWDAPVDGGSGTLTVTSSQAGAPWTAASDQEWLIVSPLNSAGSGSVTMTADATTTVAGRSAIVTVAGHTVNVTQAGGTPTFTVNPTSWSAPAGGGAQSVTVTSSLTDASWTASSDQPWLTVNPANGTGNGSVTLTADATTSAFPRSATATIAGQTVSVTQAGGTPTFTVDPTNWSASAGGGTQAVTLTSSLTDASWTTSSDQPWLTVSPANGTGNGSVTLTAVATTSAFPRSATATIAGKTVNVTQAAGTPTFSVSPTTWNAPVGGGTQAVTLTASLSDAPWSASSNQAWLTLSASSGTGNSTVTLTATANASSSSRSAVATIAGRTVNVTQAGATPTFTVSPTSWTASAAGGTQPVTVTSSLADATWTASSNASWLTVSPSGGTGNGSVTLTAAPTTSVNTRTATATIAGQTVSVTQTAGSVTLSLTKWNVSKFGGTQSVSVTVSPATVNWTASSNQGWVTVSPGNGTGNGSVTLTATANSTRKPRNATVTIGGKTLQVSQGK